MTDHDPRLYLPQQLRDSNPGIPWKHITGMRDKVIHDYVGVDVELVWTVTTDLMPTLRGDAQTILNGLAGGGPA